ncbi:Na+/H+ antiporter NhaA [Virgisporangium aurantiacum]|uniref:Na(+)/H(+) antiporter NhaA n=1 Tax=Virgisporangium aurantiacum TaxID=175570 RepID=A0A8J3Z8D1_9ACTN|nr:Na+/H+ antiporter NhaA [Virgisporangium aurantiacum]GIJ59234.1 Na(+)/H(+) antiporter NhaA [Virgisporangium aurantiacum]
MPPRPFRHLLSRGSWPEVSRVGDILRTESVGGVLLLVAAMVALAWANSPWRAAYHTLSGTRVGPAAWHLDLTLAEWSADGLLAIFFFVAGLELKREFVAGDLRDPRRAALPVAAAVGGMIAPALIYVAVVTARGAGDSLAGWAIPVATDIAFALAVLAVISTHLPAALRTFLLTLAVVDDLLGIIVIGVVYTDDLNLLPLALAMVPLALFSLGLRTRFRWRWLLLVPALATWVLVHESGVHATVAGVLLGFVVPVRGDGTTAARLEHRWRPVSAGVAVPVFAFFAAGVTVLGTGPLVETLATPVTVAVVVALVVGKTVGVLGATWATQRFTRAQLSSDLGWWDVFGLSLLAGMGFTVSLLIGELAFGTGDVRNDQAKLGILLGSLLAALLAGVVLRIRNRRYRDIRTTEELDLDADGIPDIFQTEKPDP